MKHMLKRSLALLLCLMAFVAILPVGEADAAYSMYSSSNVKPVVLCQLFGHLELDMHRPARC